MDSNFKNSFIASNKIIRYKLGVKAADILAVLIYKNDYWENEGKLSWKDDKSYFYSSLNDLKSETTYSKNVIAKSIKLLKQQGLVNSIQQGLNKPNLYSVDKNAINYYITKHESAFQNWQIKERENEASSSYSRKRINSTSGVIKKSVLNVLKTDATNNKNTNNKNNYKNITNRASSDKAIDNENYLGNEILNLRDSNNKEKNQKVESLFSFLCSMVPAFKKFTMSEEDKELIIRMVDSDIEEYKLSSKIISNASNIIEGQKENRFGNLFVGVSEMIINYDNLF